MSCNFAADMMSRKFQMSMTPASKLYLKLNAICEVFVFFFKENENEDLYRQVCYPFLQQSL